uniref:Uncharacterized protein n=1 Tax=Glossina pallidipes TaxID=7398 RepID=A0A1B0A593_GLOPL
MWLVEDRVQYEDGGEEVKVGHSVGVTEKGGPPSHLDKGLCTIEDSQWVAQSSCVAGWFDMLVYMTAMTKKGIDSATAQANLKRFQEELARQRRESSFANWIDTGCPPSRLLQCEEHVCVPASEMQKYNFHSLLALLLHGSE